MNADYFVDIGVFFGVFLCFLISMGQLLLKNKDRKNYLFVASIICLGIYQFSISFHFFSGMDNWYSIFPIVYIAGMFAIFCSIPLISIFFISLPDSNFIFKRNNLLHFLLPAAAAVVLILFGKFPENTGEAFRDYTGFIYSNNLVIRIVDIVSVIMAVVYFSYLLVFYLKLSSQKNKESKKNYFIVMLLLIIVIFFMGIYGYYNGGTGLLHNLFKLRFTILSVYFLIFSYRYPFLTNIKKLEAHRDYYLKSRIENIQTDEILASLEHLMNEEKIFRDPELTMKKTAARLGISHYQLSELLNICLHKTFVTYIKEVRVKYAGDQLVQYTDKPILAVSMECGFRSISNFNTTFKKITGLSPKEYRKKYAK